MILVIHKCFQNEIQCSTNFSHELECVQNSKNAVWYCYLYYGAVECLNLIGWRTFWGVQLFSGKRMADIAPGSFLDRITVPYYNRKIIKTHNDTGQTNKYSKQKYKIDSSCLCFATKLHFIMYGKHIAYSLSLPLSVSPSQTHIV